MTYTIRLSRTARRQLTDGLPEPVATAALEFMYGPLAENPLRVGKRLMPPQQDLWSARRGTYRILYSIDQVIRIVEVQNIQHRRDAYRT